jgi:hypothetical protein
MYLRAQKFVAGPQRANMKVLVTTCCPYFEEPRASDDVAGGCGRLSAVS